MGPEMTVSDRPRNEMKVVRIVSWMGGEHWYIGNAQFLRIEEAIRFCQRNNLQYEIVKDPHYYPRRDSD